VVSGQWVFDESQGKPVQMPQVKGRDRMKANKVGKQCNGAYTSFQPEPATDDQVFETTSDLSNN
jgi:hypothetical protein